MVRRRRDGGYVGMIVEGVPGTLWAGYPLTRNDGKASAFRVCRRMSLAMSATNDGRHTVLITTHVFILIHPADHVP